MNPDLSSLHGDAAQFHGREEGHPALLGEEWPIKGEERSIVEVCSGQLVSDLLDSGAQLRGKTPEVQGFDPSVVEIELLSHGLVAQDSREFYGAIKAGGERRQPGRCIHTVLDPVGLLIKKNKGIGELYDNSLRELVGHGEVGLYLGLDLGLCELHSEAMIAKVVKKTHDGDHHEHDQGENKL